MEKRSVKRVPIMQDGALVGIVSRADIVRAVAARRRSAKAERPDDEIIRARLVAELERQSWWRSPYAHVQVVDGIVRYSGITQSPDDRAAARVAAENVPGVRGVEDDRFTMYDIPSMV
jgi:osmotically-inducible protein OsmY